MTASWQLVLLWGVFVGLGVGSTALVFGAFVANRWFASHRGLVLGIFGAAFSTGQLVFLPSLAHLIESQGWRAASLAVASMCVLLIPLVVWVLRDRPADVVLLPLRRHVCALVPGTGPELARGARPLRRLDGRRVPAFKEHRPRHL